MSSLGPFLQTGNVLSVPGLTLHGSRTIPDNNSLENIFRQLPKNLRTPENYCILFLPKAMRKERFEVAPKLVEEWLFGSPFLSVVSNIDGVNWPSYPLNFDTFATSKGFSFAFAGAQAKAVEMLDRWRVAKVGSDVHLTRLHEQAGQVALKLEAGKGEATFGIFPTDSPDPKRTGASAYPGYLGVSSISWYENIYLDGGVSDCVASLGSFGIQVYVRGLVKRPEKQKGSFTLQQAAFLFSDTFDFSDEQPLGKWNPDTGLSMLDPFTPMLGNDTFRKFEQEFMPLFNQAAKAGILICQKFKVRSNVKIVSPGGDITKPIMFTL
jgi:Family of unknown function (DUF6402)